MVVLAMVLAVVASLFAFGDELKLAARCAGDRVARGIAGGEPAAGCGGGPLGATQAKGETQVSSRRSSAVAEVCSGGSCRGGNCFVAGTLVDTEEGLRPIESIEPGARVWSTDLESGRRVLSPVAKQIRTPSRATRAIVLEGDDGARDVVGVTAEHLFMLESGAWLEAGSLAPGDRVASTRASGFARVASNDARSNDETVWNLEVEETHTYAVGTTRSIVHNDCAIPAPFSMSDLVGLRVGERLGIVDFWVRLGAEQKKSLSADLAALRVKDPTGQLVARRLRELARDPIEARWREVTQWRPQRPPDKKKEDIYRFDGDLGLVVSRLPGDSLGHALRAEHVRLKVARRAELESRFGPSARLMPLFNTDFEFDPDIPADIFLRPPRPGTVIRRYDPGGWSNPRASFLGQEPLDLSSAWMEDRTAGAIHARTRVLARDQQAADGSWWRAPKNLLKDVAARTPLTFFFERETLAHTPSTEERFRETLLMDAVRSAQTVDVFSAGDSVFVRPGSDATLREALSIVVDGQNVRTVNASGKIAREDFSALAQATGQPLALRRAAATLADPEYFAEVDAVLGAPDGSVDEAELRALLARHQPNEPTRVWSALQPELLTIGLPRDGSQPAQLTTINRWSLAGKNLMEMEWGLVTGQVTVDQYEQYLRSQLPEKVAFGATEARIMRELETKRVEGDILQMALDPAFGTRIATEGPRVISDGVRDRKRAEFEARAWYERLGVGSWAAVKEVWYLGVGLVDLVVYASDHGNVFILVKGGRNDGRKLIYQLTASDIAQIPEGIANAFDEWMLNAQAEPDRATGQVVGIVATFFIPAGEVVAVVKSATTATTAMARARVLMRAGRVLEAEAQMAKAQAAMGKLRGVMSRTGTLTKAEQLAERQRLQKLASELEAEAARVEKELAEAAAKLEPKPTLVDPPGDGVIRQVTSSLDDLYAQAAAAQEDLANATREIASSTRGRPVIPEQLKGRARATEKIAAEYGGDSSRVLDLARSTIEYKSLDDLYAGLEQLGERYEIVRVKDRFKAPTPEGYRDIMLNARMPNGHIVEIQLHLEQILTVKSGAGHAFYEQIRGVKALAAQEGRALTAAEVAKIDELAAKSRAAYEEAVKKALPAATQAKPYSRADAARLIDSSEGATFGNNTGHARDHVPAAGQDPAALAMARPLKENTTVFRNGRQAEQALRDIMNQNEATLRALQPGQVAQGTYAMTETLQGLNSVRGATPVRVDFKQITWAIGRSPDGSFHLLHFSPRLLVK
ncbi:MAG: hypothetical protein KF819_11075 [Labilithrix sp.]|nr:hypothetical protein [Labilithrix sp.]